jgi:hypothetical protein
MKKTKARARVGQEIEVREGPKIGFGQPTLQFFAGEEEVDPTKIFETLTDSGPGVLRMLITPGVSEVITGVGQNPLRALIGAFSGPQYIIAAWCEGTSHRPLKAGDKFTVASVSKHG